MMISLIATVYNEGENIHRLMQSILQQTRLPDEIVIVDGGSDDNTVAILQSYSEQLPLKVITEGQCNISEGRNRAIAEAKGDILAITDAGVYLVDHWLEKITSPLLENEHTEVVAGFFQSDIQTVFDVAMGATVLPLADEIDPATFLPSSRSVAVRKSAVMAIQGYPEWLDYCEDLIFDLRLKQIRASFVFIPEAVACYRPRTSLSAYFRQYYLYARGDGKADLWRKRHAARYVTYLILVPIIFLLGVFAHPLFWGLYIIGGIVYLRRPYQRVSPLMKSSPDQSLLARLYIFLMIPVIRGVGDIAKMFGYPVGWWWRLRHQPPNWRMIEA